MKTSSKSRGPDENPTTPESRRSFESPEELLDFAREYFAADFPNLSRQQCPPTGRLEAIVRSGELPGDELRAHLFQCSECFRDYRQAVGTFGGSLPARPMPWWRRLAPLSGGPLPLFSTAFLLMVLLIGGVWLGREWSRQADQNRAAAPSPESPEGTSAPEIQTAPSSTTPQPTEPLPRVKPGGRKNQGLLARATIRIDLDEFPKLREADTAEADKRIELPASLIRVVIILPEGSLAGVYTLVVETQSGDPRLTAVAGSSDGKSVKATLNLRNMVEGAYRLCVLRTGEPRLCYPLAFKRRR